VTGAPTDTGSLRVSEGRRATPRGPDQGFSVRCATADPGRDAKW
jgi:hypothetical protein